MPFTMNRLTAPTDLLRERYGNSFEFALHADWNESLSTLLSHCSVRNYLSKPLSQGTLELLVAAAQSAASSSNLQLWSVIAVEDQERKDRLSQLAGGQAHIQQAPLFLVWLADLARAAYNAERRGLSHDGLNYLELFLTAAIDATLAAQNAVVAAESLDLGTVYIGALRNNPEAVALELGLPQLVFPVFGLCVGYADPAQAVAVKPRLSQSVVLHRETYNLESQAPGIDHYDQVMADFYAEQQMQVQGNWTEHSSNRVANATALRSRANLKAILNRLVAE